MAVEMSIMVRIRTHDDFEAFQKVKANLERQSISVNNSEVMLSALRERAKTLEAATHD